MRFFSITPASFSGLISLGNRIIKSELKDVEIKCEFVRPYCVAYLDQLISNANRELNIYSKYPTVNQYLKQNKFPYLSPKAKFKEDFPEDWMITLKRFNDKPNILNEEVPSWLEQEIFNKSFSPKFSSPLKRKIVKNFWEIVFNAMQHSESANGISCCGQFYPLKGYFEIAFFDNGLGIPQLVRYFKSAYHEYTDHDCIVWALKKGTSTKPNLNTGGLGLYYLRQFLKLNGGILQILSHTGLYHSKMDHIENPEFIKNVLQGTLFNVRIIYDESRYILKGE